MNSGMAEKTMRFLLTFLPVQKPIIEHFSNGSECCLSKMFKIIQHVFPIIMKNILMFLPHVHHCLITTAQISPAIGFQQHHGILRR